MVPGTGSVAVLGHLVQAVCDEGDEVVFAWRSFEAYPIVTQVGGARPVPVPLTPDARHDLRRDGGRRHRRTRMVLVCSPNNPTGPAVHAEELEAFLARVPRDVLVVLDEAYVEFVRDEKVGRTALELWRRHPNVAVLRTFSKAYGLAGLRVGYARRPPRARGRAPRDRPALRGVRDGPGGRDRLARGRGRAPPAGRRARRGAGAGRRRAARSRAGRSRTRRGTSSGSSSGTGPRSSPRPASEAGVVVRPFGGDGVRCTIGEPEANDRLIDVAAAFPH